MSKFILKAIPLTCAIYGCFAAGYSCFQHNYDLASWQAATAAWAFGAFVLSVKSL